MESLCNILNKISVNEKCINKNNKLAIVTEYMPVLLPFPSDVFGNIHKIIVFLIFMLQQVTRKGTLLAPRYH